MPPAAPPASPRSSATQERHRYLVDSDGPVDRGGGRDVHRTRSTSHTAMVCSPAAWAPITAANISARRSFRSAAGSLNGRCRSSTTSSRTSSWSRRHICWPSPMNSTGRGSMRQQCSLRLGIFGAEPWGEGMRNELERRLGLEALDIYGLSEVMGPGDRPGMRGFEGRTDPLGRPFLPRDNRPRLRPAGSRRAGRRTRPDHAHQGGHAGHPLSHPRPDAAAAAGNRAPCGGSIASAAAATTC